MMNTTKGTVYKNKVAIENVFLFFFIVFMPFQDIGLANTQLGFAGGSLSIIPLVLIMLIIIARWLLQNNFTVRENYLWCIAYMVTVTILYFISSGFVSHGENMIFKSTKLSILTMLFISPIFLIKYEKNNIIKYAVAIAFVLSSTGALLSFVGSEWLDSNPMLHATANGNMRPRGFALESSTLSIQIVTLGLLVMHFFRNKLVTLLSLLIIVTALFSIGSKGGVLVFSLTISLLILLLAKTASWKKILGVIVGMLIVLGAVNFVFDSIMTDFEEYTSTATRLSMMLTAVLIALDNPFGVGFSGYLTAISAYLPDAIALLNFPFNYAEVSSYIGSDSGKNISTKTFLFNYLMFFGWPFLIGFFLFFVALIRRVRKSNSVPLLAAVIFSVVAISTYSDGLGLYNISLVFGVAFYSAFKKINPGSPHKLRDDINGDGILI